MIEIERLTLINNMMKKKKSFRAIRRQFDSSFRLQNSDG